MYEDRYEQKLFGGKKYGEVKKNMNSVSDYHILSNLTAEQHAEGMSYDGVNKAGSKSKTINQDMLELSERGERKF